MAAFTKGEHIKAGKPNFFATVYFAIYSNETNGESKIENFTICLIKGSSP